MAGKEKQAGNSHQRFKKWVLKTFTPSYNLFFMVFNMMCISIAILSVLLHIQGFDSFIEDRLKTNDLGVVCQVITALVCCITSIIAISFSIQDSDFFGIKTKDLISLRVEWHFSYPGIAIVSIILIALNAVSFLLHWIIVSVGLSIVAVIYCIYISFTEVPLMTKDEKAGIRVLQHRVLSRFGAADVLSSKFDDALKYLIFEKNLKTAYEILTGKKPIMMNQKRFIMSKLLDVQVDMAYHIIEIEDKALLSKTIDCLAQNIRDLISFHLDIESIYGENFAQTKYYITRAIIGLSQREEGRIKTRSIICGILSSIDYSLSTKEMIAKRDYLISIFFSVCLSFTRQGDTDFLKAIKAEYSSRIYGLDEECPSTTVFALLSMYLYYMCEIEDSVPQNVKAEILKAIKCSESSYAYYSESWSTLFNHFLADFPLSFPDFYNLYLQNESALEYLPIDGQMHWIKLNLELVTKWYFTILFSSSAAVSFDYQSLLTELPDDVHYYIDKIKQQSFDENRVFVEPDEMKNIVAFYGSSRTSSFELFKTVENNSHAFFHFANQLKKDDMTKEAEETAAIKNETLAKQYLEEIILELKKEWGFFDQISINGSAKYFRAVFHKSERIINRDEVIVNTIIRSINNEIRLGTPMQKISYKKKLDDRINTIIKSGEKYSIIGSRYGIWSRISSSEIKETFMDWAEKNEEVKSRILPYGTLVKESGFAFNFSIDEFSITDLTSEILSDYVEKSKRADGQYVYDGTFMTREELENHLQKTLFLISIQLRYTVDAKKSSILYFNDHPNNHRGKESASR